MNTKKITNITIWANRVAAALVAVLIFALPALLQWYGDLLGYHPPQRDMNGIAIAYDLCALVILVALWNVEKLLGNIKQQKIFVRENTKRLGNIRWCCAVVAVICLLAVFFVLPMLIFAIIMAFLCLAISVLGCVMDAAVAIREENDLTI